ncbi:tyrosine-protein phosphatase [Nocardia carnea]|uniref:tyrosine-protein phosphatase n=1 Tax=Nocardia carnea TaxID=37328 RepID=UPI0024538C45|nr:tyrosine-protein phosphatase [Nocardia carnea]
MTSSPLADHLRISGTFNFRDLGGLAVQGGGTVRPGVLLRSAQLSRLDDTGHTTLRELGVGAVHDLRGHREIERAGADRRPPRIEKRNTPVEHGAGTPPPPGPPRAGPPPPPRGGGGPARPPPARPWPT